AQSIGAKGLAWIEVLEDLSFQSPIAKFLKAEEIEAMAKRWGLDPVKVMENILYIRAINSDHHC
ncbi:MAG TPA: hypothetical protein EYP33_05475, partial [Pyrodictium sp.]|nr:hypothetical protein [Pyrodictium sp.]